MDHKPYPSPAPVSRWTLTYSLALERVAPPSPSSVPITLDQTLYDEINPGVDLDLFYFSGSAGDVMRVNVARNSGAGAACVDVYSPSGSKLVGPFCTSVSGALEPHLTQTGLHVIVATELASDETVEYGLTVQCILGSCAPPDCTIELDPSYTGGTLNLGFYLGNKPPSATWSVWLSVLNFTIPVWSVPLPSPVDPPIPLSVPIAGFPNLGKVGILTTISQAGSGIACSDWETVDTGAAALAGQPPAEEDIRKLVQRQRPLR